MLGYAFKYKDNFPNLDNTTIQIAIDTIETLYWGALHDFWGRFTCFTPPEVGEQKRELLWNLLVASYLATYYPNELKGIASNGGMPIKSKSIENIRLVFKDVARQQSFESLTNNPFGIQALEMLQVAPETFMLYP